MISKTIGFRGLAYFQTHPNGDLKRFDQAKPEEVFRLFTKKKTDCTNRNQEKLGTHHQNGDLTLPTKTGTQNWLVEGTGWKKTYFQCEEATHPTHKSLQ